MSTEDTARSGTSTDDGAFEPARSRFAVSLAQPSIGPTTTLLILVICWWSLIELVLELGTGSGDTPQIGVVAAVRLIVIVAGLAAVAEVRLARGIFFFLCAMSVLAIAPNLPLQFERSVAVSLISFVECAGKALFVFMSCANRPFAPTQRENRLLQ